MLPVLLLALTGSLARAGMQIVDESEVLLERYRREIDENDIKDALCKDKNAGNFQKCPTRPFGLWEMVLNEFDPREEPGSDDKEQIAGCAMLDSCSSIRTPDNLYNVLTHNFIRHYEQNRAPLGLYMHAAWLTRSPEMFDVLEYWIDEILATYNDVYFVSMNDVLKWMQQPVNLRDALKYQSWRERCTALDTEDTCLVSNECALSTPALGGVKQRMQTCSSCPDYFPWLGDPRGTGLYEEIDPVEEN